jgi:hypothetical protein
VCAHWRFDGGHRHAFAEIPCARPSRRRHSGRGSSRTGGGDFSRVEDEIRDFVGRDLAASRQRLEECSDLTTANVASLSDNVVQKIDQLNAELQALRHRLQHEATRVEREVVQYASLNEAARASMRTISESLSFWQKQ